MTRRALAGLLALGTVGATAQADPPVNPFAGSWSGTWSVAEAGQDGTLDWTVSDAGRLSGRIYHAQDGDSGYGEIRGYVDADGKLVLIAFAPADDHLHGNGVPHQGTAANDGDGRLVASFTGTSNGFSVVAVLDRN